MCAAIPPDSNVICYQDNNIDKYILGRPNVTSKEFVIIIHIWQIQEAYLPLNVMERTRKLFWKCIPVTPMYMQLICQLFTPSNQNCPIEMRNNVPCKKMTNSTVKMPCWSSRDPKEQCHHMTNNAILNFQPNFVASTIIIVLGDGTWTKLHVRCSLIFNYHACFSCYPVICYALVLVWCNLPILLVLEFYYSAMHLLLPLWIPLVSNHFF